MKKIRLSVLAFFAFSLFIYSCNSPSAEKKETQKFITLGNFDSSVKPGDNFFLFVNGKWIKNHEIPPTETSIGSFLDLYNHTKDNLKALVTEAANGKHAAGTIEQKVGDFYASGMDSATIEKRGYEPVKPFLQQIEALKNPAEIMKFVADQQTLDHNILFSISIGPDEKNSSMNILSFHQGGLGLPDRDYYFKTDAATEKVVKAYQTYIQKLFRLTGDDSTAAASKTAAVYALEKQMAGSHKTNVALRDPNSNYHKMAVTALDKSMPVFGWKTLLNDLTVKADSVNVGQPEFYTKLNELLKAIPIETWKSYLRFHVLSVSANALSSDFVNARFDYVGKALNGQQQIKPRWERMISQTDSELGDALGELYVKKYFSADAKKRMLTMVNNMQKAFEARMDHLDWMSDSTKQKAKTKLAVFLKKIGYTDKWRDYSKVTIDRDKYFENLLSCGKNEYQYQINKVGKEVDKTEWGMTPPTINAYYNPTFNEIVFPAGILQFPFFDPNADDAINYGGIGMVIGHEMTHGFDDQGAQYDAEGNLKDWWTKEDAERFKAKSKSVIDLYNSFVILDSVHINGSLTTGENIADIGGLAIAYDAFKMTKEGQDTTKIDGFTPDQRFFISFAQIWRSKIKEETQRYYANVDPHSPPEYRVNGPLENFTPFYKAFNVQPGEKMYKPEAERIKIW